MRTFNVSDKYWFQTGNHLQIAGNMVCSLDLQVLRQEVLTHKITSLDLNRQALNQAPREACRAPLPWHEIINIDDATRLIECLKDTSVTTLSLAENLDPVAFEYQLINKMNQVDKFVDALKDTQIHTLDLTKCSFFEPFLPAFNADDSTEGSFEYDEELISYFASKLKGTNVTHIVGLTSSELAETLHYNMQLKKSRMIALSQGVCETTPNVDVLNHIVLYMHESRTSGNADESGYGSNAAKTAMSACNARYWEKTSQLTTYSLFSTSSERHKNDALKNQQTDTAGHECSKTEACSPR